MAEISENKLTTNDNAQNVDGELQLTRTAAKPSIHIDNPPAKTNTHYSPGLDEIHQVEFKPPYRDQGPMKDFIDVAVQKMGIPSSHAWATWVFNAIARMAPVFLYEQCGYERRLSLNFVLAGDGKEKTRRLLIDSLQEYTECEIVTNPAKLQLESYLQVFSHASTRVIIGTGMIQSFKDWNKESASKVISLDRLFAVDTLNDFLHEHIRASNLSPVAVPSMLASELKHILGKKDFPKNLFRDAIIIPSFGCYVHPKRNPEAKTKLLELLKSKLPLLPDDETTLSFSPSAQATLDQYLQSLDHSPLPIAQEGSPAFERRAGAEHHLIALSAAYALDHSIQRGEEFYLGKVSKPDVEYAIKAIKTLDSRWEGLNCVFEQATSLNEQENFFQLAIAEFPKNQDDDHGGLRITFRQLTKKFCHHPDRSGQYYSKELQTKILPQLEVNGKVKRLTGADKNVWIFYPNR